MRQNYPLMRSNRIFCGMKTTDLDGQATRHPTERASLAGTGASGAQATGLTRPRAGQDFAAAVATHTQPRGGEGKDLNICTVRET